MVSKKPYFIESPYYVGKPSNCHLLPNGPKEVVGEFKEFMEDDNPEPLNKDIEFIDLDFRVLYDIEKHIFGYVHNTFKDQGFLSAPDLFLIVIWKSNRSKSKVAKRLLEMEYPSLQEAVKLIAI